MGAGEPARGAQLSEMGPGQGGVVLEVNGAGLARRRLLEMGFVAGTPVRVVRRAPLGDPLEVDVGGYRLSLRRELAAHIRIGPAADA
ncbi:MAG: iron transporter FeoA [Planctomycetota bacterium]|nr:MAG: iron transporter FeoA [Planctomycetota bacterium]